MHEPCYLWFVLSSTSPHILVWYQCERMTQSDKLMTKTLLAADKNPQSHTVDGALDHADESRWCYLQHVEITTSFESPLMSSGVSAGLNWMDEKKASKLCRKKDEGERWEDRVQRSNTVSLKPGSLCLSWFFLCLINRLSVIRLNISDSGGLTCI